MKPTESMRALANALKSNVVVKVLVLQQCELDDGAADVIADLLYENHTLEELDLQSNKLTSVGAIAVARGLANNRGVQTINLRNQQQKVRRGMHRTL